MKDHTCKKCLDLTEHEIENGRAHCMRCKEAYEVRYKIRQIRKMISLACYIASQSKRYENVMSYYVGKIVVGGNSNDMSPHCVRLQYHIDNAIIHITKMSNESGQYILEKAREAMANYPQA